jgi:hypothetical protein
VQISKRKGEMAENNKCQHRLILVESFARNPNAMNTKPRTTPVKQKLISAVSSAVYPVCNAFLILLIISAVLALVSLCSAALLSLFRSVTVSLSVCPLDIMSFILLRRPRMTDMMFILGLRNIGNTLLPRAIRAILREFSQVPLHHVSRFVDSEFRVYDAGCKG